MTILGISAFYHDSASAVVRNGKVICAAEEERFSRVKHDNQFPSQAIDFCLNTSKLSIKDIDFITYYEKPLLKFERILDTFARTYPFSFRSFAKAIPDWLVNKIKVEDTIRKKTSFKGKLLFIPHHYSHSASAYFPSPFKRSAILTIDGVGEYQTTSLWKAKENYIYPCFSIDFPHSIGLFYSTFTAFLGFKVNSGEYKVMGLAAYGKPNYREEIKKIIKIKPDGSFNLDMRFFSFQESFQMWNRDFEKIFGKPRKPSDLITQRHKNIAASLQQITEEIYFSIINHLHSLTNEKNLCLGGGVALNSLANGKIYEKTAFQNIYIMGAAGDNGAALGSALFAYHYLTGKKRRFSLKTLELGSSYNNEQIKKEIKKYDLNYEKIDDEDLLLMKVAKLLARGKIIGWFQGKMEYGPRALGSRSILANPQQKIMKDKVNKIKRREQFRPFAGSVLQEKVHQYFHVPERKHSSPFMTFVFKVKKRKKKEVSAIVHQDNTCRVQTVSKQNNRYYRLIKNFYKITGTPCLLNTSFNLRDEPIVENPNQAIEDFLKTSMDCLVIGDFLVSKVNHK